MILRDVMRKAKKTHTCDGQYQIDRLNDPENENAPPPCEGINKGDVYHYQVNMFDGFGVWKSCKTCQEFIIQEWLYDEDVY